MYAIYVCYTRSFHLTHVRLHFFQCEIYFTRSLFARKKKIHDQSDLTLKFIFLPVR